jgi:hypothetical protein
VGFVEASRWSEVLRGANRDCLKIDLQLEKFIKCLKSISISICTHTASRTHTITQKRDSIDFDMENGKVHQEFFDL